MAGCYSITYAIETASPRLQKLINKNLDLEKVKQAIEWTSDAGIIPKGFLMIGFPSETREEMEETIKFSMNTKLKSARFFAVVVYPRTQMEKIAKQFYPNFDFGKVDFDSMRYWAKKSFYSRVTGVNLARIQSGAVWRFHSRPKIFLNFFWILKKNYFLAYYFLRSLRKYF
jgi:radical SAM superfamily enzyme YgiQ (UPF0313 family)